MAILCRIEKKQRNAAPLIMEKAHLRLIDLIRIGEHINEDNKLNHMIIVNMIEISIT